jgi:hypothetical protein
MEKGSGSFHNNCPNSGQQPGRKGATTGRNCTTDKAGTRGQDQSTEKIDRQTGG